jgi:cytochrome c-type biogenesis protein CcmE
MVIIALFLGGTTLIILTTLKDQLLFFMMPTEALMKRPTAMIRLGGLVEEGSLNKEADHWITFRITDGSQSIPVRYRGLVPDLFREGKGVVAEGVLSKDGIFQSTYIMAKHDENYMPPEVAEALKANGRWRPKQNQQEKK